MKRRFSVQEALERPVEQNMDKEASESEDDTNTDDEEFSLESDSSDESETSENSSESGEYTEENAGPSYRWTSKNGQISWSSTHTETLRYTKASGVKSSPSPVTKVLLRSFNDRKFCSICSKYDKLAGKTFTDRLEGH